MVAAHEFGHALGLKHSQNPESVMYPTYKHSKAHNLLSSEDIMNINTLYGKNRLCFKVSDCEIVILWEQRQCSVSTFIWEITCLCFISSPTEPRDKRPFPSSRFSWGYPSNPWFSSSYFPVSFKDTCNPDLTFDAVTTVGEAIFFFRDKYVDLMLAATH